MPIYEYQCEVCNTIIEAFQKISDEPMKTCPKCSGDLKKLISMNSFQLKGGGWYADGYSGSASSCAGAGACSAAKDTSSPASSPSASGSCSSACKCS